MDERLFHYRRVVQWADCDPARIAFTGSFLDFSMEAIDAWWREVIGTNFYHLNTVRELGAPMVRVELDFRAMLVPGDRLCISVCVLKAGSSSIHFEVHGGTENKPDAFSGKLVCVMIAAASNKPVRLPEDIRRGVDSYIALCMNSAEGQ